METPNSAIHAHRTQATLKDYPGRMSALFFTSGCNFQCGFCHNPALFCHGKTYTWDELDEICSSFRRQWVSAVTISGGEPTLQPSLPETIEYFKRNGFAVKLDTNGSNPAMLEQIIDMLDYVAMDIKCSFSKYPELTGFEEIDKLEASIKIIMGRAADYEFRTTVIETIHAAEEIKNCAKTIQGAKKYVLQPFLPHDDLPFPAFRTLHRTRSFFLENFAGIAADFVKKVEIRNI